ncbi:hypothetical protein FGG08_002817 [Glutinoglossum americanum]|uniref:Uncharacterized protein n=1 Tax=Glutinoglossum americanum TaxID=1670608 RepID=A0A9P8I5N3_9PEZI|nr:hypothetical protein FGG08_002817 [Glutinoglossum americanum]
MKANYQKSKVKINKKQQGYAKLMTQDDINEALKEYNTKQRELAKIATKKSQKGRGEGVGKSKGKRVTRKATVLYKDLIVSESGSRAQVSDSEENISLRAIVISSDISDSEVSKVSESYIQRLRKVLTAGPSREVSHTGMVTRITALELNFGVVVVVGSGGVSRSGKLAGSGKLTIKYVKVIILKGSE